MDWTWLCICCVLAGACVYLRRQKQSLINSDERQKAYIRKLEKAAQDPNSAPAPEDFSYWLTIFFEAFVYISIYAPGTLEETSTAELRDAVTRLRQAAVHLHAMEGRKLGIVRAKIAALEAVLPSCFDPFTQLCIAWTIRHCGIDVSPMVASHIALLYKAYHQPGEYEEMLLQLDYAHVGFHLMSTAQGLNAVNMYITAFPGDTLARWNGFPLLQESKKRRD